MASTPQELLERCSKLLLRFVQEDAALCRELSPARVEFFGGDLSDHGADAERRFQEWFLYERPSKARLESPAFSFQERLLQDLPEKARAFAEKLPESVFGAFEIEEDLDGAWNFQDMLNQREYVVHGPIQEQDDGEPPKNIVGRLFPWNDEYFLSPTTKRFLPSGELWEALRDDLLKVRQTHAGSRISQTALESVIWPKEAMVDAPAVDLGSLASKWDALVSNAPEFSFTRVEAAVKSAKSPGSAITEILNRMAFETKANLGEARVLLLQIKTVASEPMTAPSSKPCPCGSAQPYDECCRAADAVRAFEEGKARGENLDALFRKLEVDMGLDPEEDEDTGEVPTDPELTPLAEEFLWEVRPEGGDELLGMIRHLEQQENPPLTHLEELTEEHLRRYLTVVFPVSDAGKNEAKAGTLLKVLAQFGLWADLEQGVPLAATIDRLAKELEVELPRIARCNRIFANGTVAAGKRSTMEPWMLQATPDASGRAPVQSLRDQATRFVKVSPEATKEIRRGDVLFVQFAKTEDPGRVLAVFPSQAKPFFE